jgi:threonine dehydrogenase-like Zn-dependent dehydrogenase
LRAVHCKGGQIAVVDIPQPTGPGIRVHVKSAGICGSDLHMIDGGWPIAGVPGHEIAGELADGTAVAVEPIVACGHCPACERGEYNLCPSQLEQFIGIGRDGGMAEELVVPESCLVPLAPGVAASDACLVEPLAVAVHGLEMASLSPDLRIAVIGGGTIGLCAVAAARPSGAEVVLAARHDHQREAGERLGARMLDPDDPGAPFDVVVDCAGSKAALAQACTLARPGGSLVLLASYWDGFEPPGMILGAKEIRILPSFMYRRYADGSRDVEEAAALLAGDPEIARTLITHRFPLDAAPEAFETARDRARGAIKVVLSP